MGVGKITIAALTVAAATLTGITITDKTLDRNQKALQTQVQEYHDTFVRQPYSTIEKLENSASHRFMAEQELSEKTITKQVNKLLKGTVFSNPDISAQANLINGQLEIKNCNIADTSKLKQLLMTPENSKYALVLRGNDIEYNNMLFKTQKDNTIIFALDDIENKAIKSEYLKFNALIREKLLKLLPTKNISYDKISSCYIVKPAKGIYLKDIVGFFPGNYLTKEKFNFEQFKQLNTWAKSIFFNPNKAITKSINIPYVLVTRALSNGIKHFR